MRIFGKRIFIQGGLAALFGLATLAGCGRSPVAPPPLAPDVTIEDQQEAEGIRLALPEYLEIDPSRMTVIPGHDATRVVIRGVSSAEREKLEWRVKYFSKAARYNGTQPIKPIYATFD
jgi:hypothetical protein